MVKFSLVCTESCGGSPPARSAEPAEKRAGPDERGARERRGQIAGPARPGPRRTLPHQLDLGQRRLLGRAAARRKALLDAADEVGQPQQRGDILADAVRERGLGAELVADPAADI